MPRTEQQVRQRRRYMKALAAGASPEELKGREPSVAAARGAATGAAKGAGSPPSVTYKYEAERKRGGPVKKGRRYKVGEKGPEKFVPKTAKRSAKKAVPKRTKRS